MKHVACVFNDSPWQGQVWDGNSAGRVRVGRACGTGKISQTHLGVGQV